jgi:hypothetical protein
VTTMQETLPGAGRGGRKLLQELNIHYGQVVLTIAKLLT